MIPKYYRIDFTRFAAEPHQRAAVYFFASFLQHGAIRGELGAMSRLQRCRQGRHPFPIEHVNLVVIKTRSHVARSGNPPFRGVQPALDVDYFLDVLLEPVSQTALTQCNVIIFR